MTTNVGFAKDIRPLFRDKDISCMKREANLDLSDYDQVKRRAKKIYDEHKSHSMPEGGAYWTASQLALLDTWINTGMNP